MNVQIDELLIEGRYDEAFEVVSEGGVHDFWKNSTVSRKIGWLSRLTGENMLPKVSEDNVP